MKKRILIIGSGAREHALGWKLQQSKYHVSLFFAPGNAGTAGLGKNVDVAADDIAGLVRWVKKYVPDLVVVGPEVPLSLGITDALDGLPLTVIGPTRAAARLECSKAWAAAFMERHDIPHPRSVPFSDAPAALAYLASLDWDRHPVVVKADGLAAGKGVFVPETRADAIAAVERIMVEKAFQDAGSTVVLQERLSGKEVSVLAFTDGRTVAVMPPVADYKRIGDGDTGPNTGGMGAITPVPYVPAGFSDTVTRTILEPVVAGMSKEGNPYRGILYAGLMLTADGPAVLEFNCRFGDPETEVLMRLLRTDLVDIFEHIGSGILDRLTVDWSDEAAVCVVLAAAGYPGKPESNRSVHIGQLPADVIPFHAGTTVQDQAIRTAGGRVLAVTATGATLGAARQDVYAALSTGAIRFAGMQYRRDIGITADTTPQRRPFRLEVGTSLHDTRVGVRQKQLTRVGVTDVRVTEIRDVFTIDTELTPIQLAQVQAVLANPVSQRVYMPASGAPDGFDWAVEIGFLPGVTDNVGHTTEEMIADVLARPFGTGEHVYSSQLFLISGNVSLERVREIASGWHNPLIQRVHIKAAADFLRDGGMDPVVPKVQLTREPSVSFVDLHVPDDELAAIGKQGIRNPDGTRRGPLALDIGYLTAIRTYFDGLERHPTDVELESIAQTWSEHCKHTIFADPIDELPEGLFRSYIKRATTEIRRTRGKDDFCVSVFTDNSGAIEFNDEYLVTDKVETHNSPSALDPFGGAITGIVGVNRDALGFGLGAKPVLNRYGFCFGFPDDSQPLYRDRERTQPLLSASRIIDGVIDGVNSGGNCSGIPTTQGFMYFDQRYRGKPLVFVGTVGLIPKTIPGGPAYAKRAMPGDYIVMAGGRVGLDGIHGATFSSEALTTGSPATAVQIGDPITQKKLSDALIREARDRGLYHSITDNGAGGLSCSVAEMAKEAGGCYVRLEQIPLKYPGLEPWQIWISESQERMTLAVPPESWPELSELMRKWGVEATVIGEFTDSGICRVEYQGTDIMHVDMDFLHNGLPPRPMRTTYTPAETPADAGAEASEYTGAFLALLSRLNIGSYEQVSSQYDHEVQGTSVLKPLQGKGRVNGDATVIRPVYDSDRGVIVSQALYPGYTELNAYKMAAAAVDTAIRNSVAAGADPDRLALLDNFCWCSATEPERLGQLKQAVRACYDYAVAYGTPFISGKDSMFNDFKGFDASGEPVKISVPPTLLISTLGTLADASQVVSLDPKVPGDLVYLLGETSDELGGSEYYRAGGRADGLVPAVDAATNMKLYRALHTAITAGLVASAQSLHLGGLAAAVGKAAVAGKLGLEIDLGSLPGQPERDDVALFSESQGRILVTVAPQHEAAFTALFGDLPVARIGTVLRDRSIRIRGRRGTVVVDATLADADRKYRAGFGIIYHYAPKALVLSGYGLNCEEETAVAFGRAGAAADIVHVNDLVGNGIRLSQYEIMAVPGGFSFGDDTGSGNAYAWKLRSHLWEQILEFVGGDHLVLGICNGFQILVNLGLLPALDGQYGTRHVALMHNDSARYVARWVDLNIDSPSPWMTGIHSLSLPIAHGEGKMVMSPEVLAKLKQHRSIAARYTHGEICSTLKLPANPTGTTDDIAALTDDTGKILGLMPHPERAVSFTQQPHWTWLREQARRAGRPVPADGPGLSIFRNGVAYFSV